MKLARAVERKLERMLDGVAGRVFTGRVHPTEIASRMVREADFESTEHDTGIMVPNAVRVTLHPDDLEIPPPNLARLLAEAYDAHAAEEGWRLPGPTYVAIRLDSGMAPGGIKCEFEIRKGQRRPWGHLNGKTTLSLTNNRMWVGRSEECDVVIAVDSVSRRHASIVRRHGSVWVTDLGSSNGTRIDGQSVASEPVEFRPGSVITFADQSFRLEIA